MQILDPLERTCEILFGVIVVLTFTGSISVAEAGHAETRTVLIAAVGCNLAWGIVDGAMFLLSSFAERARKLTMLRAIRAADGQGAAGHLILDALPSPVAAVLTPAEVEELHQRLNRQPEPPAHVSLNRADFAGAAAVCLLVFSSTLPIAIPFFLTRDMAWALRVSNMIALAMLFVTGWSLGRHAGRPGWRGGLSTVMVGVVLVVVTKALGG